MRTVTAILALFLGILGLAQVALSVGVPKNIVVTLRGKKYELSASTVEDIKKEMEEKAGLKAGQQGILFKGKMLGNEESLSDAGVADGDNLLIVPKAGFSRPRPAAAGGIPAAESSEEGSAEAGATNPLAEGPAGEIMQMINSYTNHPLFQALSSKDMSSLSLDDLLKLKQLTDSFMCRLVRSPVVKSYLEDEGNLDELRVRLKTSLEMIKSKPEIAANPQLSAMLPLLENPMIADALGDTKVFRDQIMAVVNEYLKMEDPMPDDSGVSLDPSLLGAAKSDDEVEDLDTLPDDHKKEL